MSLYSRRVLLLGALTGLAGCGFEPAFTASGGATKLQNRVRVDDPLDRPAYLLTREIEDRLGRGAAVGDGGAYGLSYDISISILAAGITSTNEVTRFNLQGEVAYALRDLDSTAVLLSGQVSNFTSYSASGTTVATQAAARDAEDRLMVILADQIVDRLIAEADSLPA
ncbi:MAG: LPS assembly lipoprotein LptE [Pseudomonadota bacterium]